jgi:hypothetical protein
VVVLDHPDGVDAYFASPDGSAVAFTCTAGASRSAEIRERLLRQGAIIDTARIDAVSTLGSWPPADFELWIQSFDTEERKRLSLPETPGRFETARGGEIDDVTWTDDGATLAVGIRRKGGQQKHWPGSGPMWRVLIVDRTSGRTWPLHDSDLLDESHPRWAADGRSVLVLTRALSRSMDHPLRLLRDGGEYRLTEMAIDGTEGRRFSPPGLYGNRPPFLKRVWWAKDGRVFSSATAPDGLTETVVRLSPGAAPVPATNAPWNLSGCVLARDAPLLACVRPPRLA